MGRIARQKSGAQMFWKDIYYFCYGWICANVSQVRFFPIFIHWTNTDWRWFSHNVSQTCIKVCMDSSVLYKTKMTADMYGISIRRCSTGPHDDLSLSQGVQDLDLVKTGDDCLASCEQIEMHRNNNIKITPIIIVTIMIIIMIIKQQQ